MLRIATLSLASLALAPAAHAFCGTYVGGAGANLYNNVSQVAVVRQQGRTTLSMSNDVEGDTTDFAMVIPVPEVLAEDDIHVLDHGLFTRLDQYSAPRLVEYTCEDFEERDSTDDSGGWAAGGDVDEEGDGGVEVEAEYVVGEYQIVILSAGDSAALFTWLEDNGYAVPASSQDLLQEYIDADQYFFAAKIDEDAGIASGDKLSPLQFSYETDAFAVPIRLGTLNAREQQDLILYAINGYASGRVGISNYTEIEIEDECMWESEGEDFQTFYAERFADAYAEAGEAVWLTEYAWGGSGCDPCTGTPPDEQDLITLGYDQTLEGDWRTVYDVYFTRIHMRYAPYEVSADLTLYHSNLDEQIQQRYIRHEEFLEDRFPVCDEGMRDDPGSCDPWNFSDEDDGDAEVRAGCGSKSSAPLGVGLLGLLGFAALGRRRR
jgi:hypothetical protein